MSFDFDVVIVGAGPVGSTVAHHLASNGLDVAMFDKKKQIGYPLQCAGILSRHILEANELPDDVIVNEVKGAFLHTQNHVLNVRKDETVAYVIDRIAYDEFLLERAIESGVKFISQKAVDVDSENGITYFSNGKTVKSKVIIGCDGHNSFLSDKMGNVQNNFPASQMLVEIDGQSMCRFRKSNESPEDYVDTYLINDILPGFLWIIPVGDDLYRIGLFSNHNHKQQSGIIRDFLDCNFDYEIIEKYKGFIPIFDEKNRMVENRVLLIGDAAGQVKPTSGGGLLIAFDACRMAEEYVCKAIGNDDVLVLKEYENEFKGKYLKEFGYQFKVQRTLNLLSDNDLDYLFMKLRQNDCERLISQYGDMDTQSRLVKEFIKRGLIFKIMPKFLFKKIVNIFGFR